MHWYALAVNPEPWAVGPIDIGRKGGHYFANMGRNQQVAAFQEAVREDLGGSEGLITGKFEFVFYFWRHTAAYTTPNQRQHRKHEADGTNMCKALEDALQSIFYVNDRDAIHGEWYIVAQGPDVAPCILIGIQECDENAPATDNLPDEALIALGQLMERQAKAIPTDLKYDSNTEDLF